MAQTPYVWYSPSGSKYRFMDVPESNGRMIELNDGYGIRNLVFLPNATAAKSGANADYTWYQVGPNPHPRAMDIPGSGGRLMEFREGSGGLIYTFVPDPVAGGGGDTGLESRVAALEASVAALQDNVTVLASRQQISNSVAVTNPVGTTSNAYVMQGIDLRITAPVGASRALLMVTGEIGNSDNNGQTFTQIRAGIGASPANGDADIGTPIGQEIQFISTTAAAGGAVTPFAIVVLVDVTPGSTFWVDLALRAVAGTASLSVLQLTGVTLIDAVTL